MKYFCFDIECSNTDDRIGKICEFGYVILNRFGMVIKKKNIYINPESNFSIIDVGKRKGHKFLSYDEFFYKKQPTFPYFYKKIKKLLTKKNTMYYAFASKSDLDFVLGTILRYKLPVFDFICYDAQKITKKFVKQLTKAPGLETTYNLLVKNGKKLPLHNACFDSYKEAKILSQIAKENHMTIEEISKKTQGAEDHLLKYLSRKEIDVKIEEIAEQIVEKDVSILKNGKYAGLRFYVQEKVFNENIEDYYKILLKIKEKNGVKVTSITRADFIIINNEKDVNRYANKTKKSNKYKYIYTKDFLV